MVALVSRGRGSETFLPLHNMSKVYSILAHPNKQSLNASMFGAANQFFVDNGYTVQTCALFDHKRDLDKAAAALYDKRFFPNSKLSNYLTNWVNNKKLGLTTNFVRGEIEKIKDSDILFIQTPIWVYALPAMLKSYIEQVFLFGEFFNLYDTHLDTGFRIENLIHDKTVIFSITCGGSRRMVEHVMGSVENLTNPIKSQFEFIGFNFATPHITWATTKTDAYCEEYQANLINYLRSAF